MKAIRLLPLSLLLGLAPVGHAAEKASTDSIAVFTPVPKMSCQNCENKIKQNIRFERGVKEIATSLKDQTITIRFNPAKTSTPSLTTAFKKIGYTVTPSK